MEPSNNEVYDWSVEETATPRPVEVYQPQPVVRVNPANGHVAGCACTQCPTGQAAVRELHAAQRVAPDRKPNALVDTVIPACVLMAVFTICAVVVIPVVVPLLSSLIPLVGMAVVSLVVVSVLVTKVLGSRVTEKIVDKK